MKRHDTIYMVAGWLAALALTTSTVAKADTASTITGTVVDGFYTVNSPWGANVAVNIILGRKVNANGTIAQTVICYENTVTGDVGVAVPPQNGSGTLTFAVRLNGTSKTDFVQLLTYTSRTTTSTPFCSSGPTGLFPGVSMKNANAGGFLVYVDVKGGNDQLLGEVYKATVILGAGNDLAYVFARDHLYVDSNDGSAGIDDIYSTNSAFDGEILNVGNAAHDCMTDASARLEMLMCGGAFQHLYITSPTSQITRITDRSLTYCLTPMTNYPNTYCYDILPQFR